MIYDRSLFEEAAAPHEPSTWRPVLLAIGIVAILTVLVIVARDRVAELVVTWLAGVS